MISQQELSLNPIKNEYKLRGLKWNRGTGNVVNKIKNHKNLISRNAPTIENAVYCVRIVLVALTRINDDNNKRWRSGPTWPGHPEEWPPSIVTKTSELGMRKRNVNLK